MFSFASFVFISMLAVATGQWSCWSDWSSCSRTCGTGSQRRSRSCSGTSSSCSGPTYQDRYCNTHTCPVNGVWSNWSSWSVCSRSCSIGEYVRFRNCNNPPPAYGGVYCSGPTSETGFCNTHSCPIDGQWGMWAEWLSCNASCGEGLTTRSRECNDPKPHYGGRYCAPPSIETTKCMSNITCPERLTADSTDVIVAVTVPITVLIITGIVVVVIYRKRCIKDPENYCTGESSAATLKQHDTMKGYEDMELTRQSVKYDDVIAAKPQETTKKANLKSDLAQGSSGQKPEENSDNDFFPAGNDLLSLKPVPQQISNNLHQNEDTKPEGQSQCTVVTTQGDKQETETSKHMQEENKTDIKPTEVQPSRPYSNLVF